MKAIILAAGMGTRLDKYTHNMPKCMLNFNGKTLIERQVETLRECGITDISAVTGYMKEKIKIKGIKYYNNSDYASTNMVASLFCAEEEMDDDILVCYGDLIYEKKVIQKILDEKADIGVTVDADFLDYWKARLDDWEKDMESLVIGHEGNIVEIGVPRCPMEKARVRYVGLIRFSRKGIETLKKIFHENKEKYWDKDEKFMNSKSFRRLYMTDMIQMLIDRGVRVNPVITSHGWLEFDTNEDYEKAVQWLEDGSLKRFYDIGSV